mmetsp:Transcript_34850/g.93103  ORF Transcript_34850/g.93103 Transcript_34850/m.93103 type:complete len:203 (+) Transcript_34850:1054-1662(+)
MTCASRRSPSPRSRPSPKRPKSPNPRISARRSARVPPCYQRSGRPYETEAPSARGLRAGVANTAAAVRATTTRPTPPRSATSASETSAPNRPRPRANPWPTTSAHRRPPPTAASQPRPSTGWRALRSLRPTRGPCPWRWWCSLQASSRPWRCRTPTIAIVIGIGRQTEAKAAAAATRSSQWRYPLRPLCHGARPPLTPPPRR